MRVAILPLAVLACLVAAEARAQAPSPAPSPAPSSPPSPATARPPAPAGPFPADAGEVHVRAESQGGVKGRYEFRGFVDLQAGGMRIQADKLDLLETDRPGGGTERRIVAEGNVVFLKGEERLAGERMSLDLDSGKGVFEEATGYVQPGVLVEARRIERLDADSYRIEGGRFTSCFQPSPRWSFSASSARLDVDDKVVARNVVFRVKKVPAFYLPYLIYPIQEDQRSTGLLFPSFGYSSYYGFTVGTGFFWAMGRSHDQTVTVEHHSKLGTGVGHEFRYLLTQPSRGTFRTYALRRSEEGVSAWNYDFDYTAVQVLPGKVRANLQVRYYSTVSFQQQIQETIELLSLRTRRASFNAQRAFGSTSVSLIADQTQTLFGYEENRRVQQHLPTLRVSRAPKKLGRTGLVLSLDGTAERLGTGDETTVENYSRFDLGPRLQRPLATSFLRITPQVQYRFTRYGAAACSYDFPCEENRLLRDETIDRRYFEARTQLEGPTLFRIFDRPGGFYSERFKHTLGPEVTWTYRSRVDRFFEIPQFDGTDTMLGTNEFEYALVNRLYAKRPGRGGKLEPWQFLQWRVSQTYYVNVADGQSYYDPNYPSAYFDTSGEPSHVSPLRSLLRLNPTREIGADLDVEYDVNYRAIRRLSLSTNVRHSRLELRAGWSRYNRLSTNPDNRGTASDSVRGSGRIEILPGRLTVDGSADYDIANRTLLNSLVRARYGVQCCAFIAEMRKSKYGIRDDGGFRFAIELANVGTVGTFNGSDAVDRRRQTGGFY